MQNKTKKLIKGSLASALFSPEINLASGPFPLMRRNRMTLDEIVNKIAEEIKPEIQKIEANKFPTTKWNYGTYLNLLGIFKEKRERQVYALALIKAGANRFGVESALKIF